MSGNWSKEGKQTLLTSTKIIKKKTDKNNKPKCIIPTDLCFVNKNDKDILLKIIEQYLTPWLTYDVRKLILGE